MAKKIKAIIKLYCPAGQANPAPPVGPALGQHGLNIMDFCKKFNEKTKGQEGLTLPVVITAYEDKSYTFIVKSPPASVLLKRACGLAKASGTTGKDISGALLRAQVEDIAKMKMVDLNAPNLKKAVKIIEGTARSMGIQIVETEEDLKKVVIKKEEEAPEKPKPEAPKEAKEVKAPAQKVPIQKEKGPAKEKK